MSLAAAAAIALLGGCGQKGPLYLPADAAHSPTHPASGAHPSAGAGSAPAASSSAR